MHKTQSNILKEVGNSFVREGKYEAAVAIYLKALNLNNCCPLIHSNIAFAYYYLQKFDLSIAHARICIDLDPSWFKGYLRLAKATFEKSGPWAAIEVLRAGIQFSADKKELSDFYLELTRNFSIGQPLNQQRSSYGNFPPIFSDSRNRKDVENSATKKQSVDKSTVNYDCEVVVVNKSIPHPVIGEVKNCSVGEQNSSESSLSFTPTSTDINDKKTLESKELICLDSEVVKEQNSLNSNTESAAVVDKNNSSEFSSAVSSVDINIYKNNSELCTPVCQDSADQRSVNNATATTHAASEADITHNQSVNYKKMQTNEEKDSNETKPKTNKPITSEVIKDDKFLKMVEELTCASQKHLFQKEKLNESLKEGYTTFEKKLYRRAIDCYKEALKIAASTPLKSLGITSSDVAIINYILNLARIESNNYEKIAQAVRDINDSQHLSAVMPALNYLLGKAYCKLNRFKKALEPLQKCEEALHDPCLFTNKFWPSTDIVMQETTKDGLEEYVMELVHLCTMCPEKPTAICRFNRCTEISSHIIPSDQIYVSDPDFIGYVTVICDEKCNIQYHIQCWKAYKDSFSSCEKIHDKDMLDRPCPTTDCLTTNNVQSKICAIEIFGQDGNLKTQVKTERQLKPTVSKNAKKRKHKQSHSDEKPAEKVHTTAKSKVTKTKKNKNKDVSDNTASSTSSSSVTVSAPIDTKEEMNKRLTVLEQLREINFGCVIENIWNPCEPYYGRCDEKEKKENMIFIPSELADEDHTRQYYKDYVFSWFFEVLSKEGPMKVDEVQEQWISGSNNDDNDNVFSEVKLVLHDVTDVCDLLLESTRFCLIDDNICLSEQLSETYEEAKTELVESVEFMLSEYQQQQLQPTTQIESGTSDKIKKISETASEPSAVNIEDTYISDSSGESDEDEDYGSEDESDDEEEVDVEEEFSEEEVLVKQPVEVRVNEVIKTSDNEHCVHGDVKKVLTRGNIPVSETSFTSESQSSNNHIPDKSNKESTGSVAVPNTLNDDCKVSGTVDKAKTDHHNSVDKGLSESGNQTEQERLNMMKQLEMFKMSFSELVHQDRDQKTKELTEKYEESRKLVKKLTEEKLKLIDQKQHTINKYEQQIAKKEASFLKVKEQLLEQRELTVSQAVEASKQVLQLTQSRDAERIKLESHISELQSKKQAASLSQLEMQFKYCELIFNKHTERKNEKLSELQYFSSFDYLPCHNEAMRLIKNWDDFSDKLSKCKIQFNLLYDRLKSMVETGIDIDINGMLSSLTPTDLIEPDPASIPYQTFINQIIDHTVNKNNNNFQSSVNSKNIATQIGTHTKQAAQASSIRKKSSEVGASIVKSEIDANENQLTSTRDGSPEFHEDDDDAFVTRSESDDLENIYNVTALTRNRNNSTGSDKGKQKFLKKSTQANKSSSVSKDNEAQDHDASSEKQSKKKKKGKSDKQPQHQEQQEQSLQPCVPIAKQQPPPTTVKPSVLEKMTMNSIWGSMDLSQNNLNDTVTNDNNNEEWQVCVDRRTLREHASLAAPSVPAVTKGKSHYVKLMERLKRKFPTRTEKELSTCVKSVRERNNCSLSGLSMDEIEFRVERLLVDKLPKKPVSMGLEKFGESAWGGGVISSNSNWQGSVDMMEECVICCEDMGLINLTTLECNHPFHTECIRQWLKEKSVCPLCNKFTKMPDEFPAL